MGKSQIILRMRKYSLGPSSVEVAGEHGCDAQISGFVISSGRQNSVLPFGNGTVSSSF